MLDATLPLRIIVVPYLPSSQTRYFRVAPTAHLLHLKSRHLRWKAEGARSTDREFEQYHRKLPPPALARLSGYFSRSPQHAGLFLEVACACANDAIDYAPLGPGSFAHAPYTIHHVNLSLIASDSLLPLRAAAVVIAPVFTSGCVGPREAGSI